MSKQSKVSMNIQWQVVIKFGATRSGCHRSHVMQELEKGVDALLEQYKGMEEQQEEELQSAPLTAAPAQSTKRNRHTLTGMLTPFSYSPNRSVPHAVQELSVVF